MLHLPLRPRRNRKSETIRQLVREATLSASNLIYPLFVHDSPQSEPIESMPGCFRFCIDDLVTEAQRAYDLGISSVILFPVIAEKLKTRDAKEALNPDGIMQRAIYALKEAIPQLTVITDVALDPYNADGHDGIVEHRDDGSISILNDPTVDILCQQALTHADAGADIVAPSDMMDGRVAIIRSLLDSEGYIDVSIMAYTAKYASALYAPFRVALNSSPKLGDKRTYQMNPANVREAIREAQLDEAEGADIMLIKPASLYLDVISTLHKDFATPLAAFQVSGEYLMIKSAAQAGWIDERATVLESLLCMRRAGASMIVTYFAPQAAEWLR